VLAHQPQRFKSVHARHEDVEEQQVERFCIDQVEAATAVIGGNDGVAGALQEEPQRRLHRMVVVN
jgi:hypothetical protein